MISAFGIVVGIITAVIGIRFTTVDEIPKIERTLKVQIGLSTVLMTPCLYFASVQCLPDEFYFRKVAEGGDVTAFSAFMCTALGLWSGLIIGLVTEYYTSTEYAPV